MSKIPSVFYKIITQVVFFLVIPAFFLSFLVLYQPRLMVGFIAAGRDMFYFNATMMTAILLVVVVLSRMLIFILRKHLRLNWIFYSLWTLGEVVIASFFMGLYLTLMSRGLYNYFSATGYCLLYSLLVLIYPYLTAIIIYNMVAVYKSKTETVDESLLRFQDSTKRLKLVVAAEALLYVEAKENYVKIFYLDNDNIREYLLHNTMIGIEPIMVSHGMVRCQRSYYVNPRYVRVLQRDKNGSFIAVLAHHSAAQIPVSAKYYDLLSSKL